MASCILFHFYIKPQLLMLRKNSPLRCILFHFYIKPQHFVARINNQQRCILFHFYIKPQHLNIPDINYNVVSYSISTSNHNLKL